MKSILIALMSAGLISGVALADQINTNQQSFNVAVADYEIEHDVVDSDTFLDGPVSNDEMGMRDGNAMMDEEGLTEEQLRDEERPDPVQDILDQNIDINSGMEDFIPGTGDRTHGVPTR